MNNSVRNLSAINPCCFRKSQWEAISRYHKLTPCVVSEKNWNKEEEVQKRITMLAI